MKNIALLALCAAPVMAGTPVTTIAPTPTPVPTPAVSPWAIEIGAVGNLANRDFIREGSSQKVDTYGADITALYHMAEHHALTLRLSYIYGSETFRFTDEAPEENYSAKATVQTFSIMPGYRYTHPLTDRLSAFAGANIGLAHERVTAKDEFGKDGANDWGFAYAAELGLSYRICPHTSLYAAVQYSGNTVDHWDWNTQKQNYTGLRMGVNYRF